MKRLSIILLLSGVFVLNTYGQEPRIYSQFFMNPFIYNPSYAGVDGHSVFFLMYRQQWTSIDGAPTIAHASFHTPLPNGLGVGGSIFNESQGLLTNSGVKGAVSYLLNIDRTHFLRFGLSMGVGTTSLNFSELDDPTDPAFTNLVSDELYTIGEFGVTYHTGHFNFGFALPSLFSFDVVSEEDFSPVRVTPLDRALLKVNYRGHFSDDFAFEPHLIYRYSKNNADQFEVAGIVHLKHIVWVGGAYRQDAGMVGLIGAKIAEKFALGYAYELGKPEIPALTGNTHEIHIGFHLGTRKDHAEHVSSFIKSHRLTAEERAAKAEEERLAKLEALAAQDEEDTDDQDTSDTTSDPEDTQDTTDDQTLEDNEDQEITQQDYTNTTVINPDNINKDDLKETWVYVNPSSTDNLTRVSPSGEIETAVVFTRINEAGEKETMVEFLPDPPPGSKTTWSIANPNEEPKERVNENGEKEVGIEWVEIDENGEEKRITKWSKVYTGEVETEDLMEDMAPGYTIPESSEVPVINVEERIKPNEKVEELKIEFDNTSAAKERVTQETITDDTETNTTAQPPVVRKPGNHRLELPAGHHIIDGAFSSFENAEKQSDLLFQRGFTDVKVGYQSERGLYYVVISSHQDVAEARSRRNQIRQNANYADVWVLSVGN